MREAAEVGIEVNVKERQTDGVQMNSHEEIKSQIPKEKCKMSLREGGYHPEM